MALLEIRSLTKLFGGLTAIFELDLDVHKREIVGLIGPNGAGKSTALNMIGGVYLPTNGQILLCGEDITSLSSYHRAARGIARVFQDNLLFSTFSVLENVLAGLHLQTNMGLRDILFGGHRAHHHDQVLINKSLNILESLGIASEKDELAMNLPHGKQRILSLAIALAPGPRLLLLDEPITGMNAEEVETMLAMIRALRDEKGITCIIIEHNLRAVMGLCDRIAVLNFGKKIAEGAPGEIVENPAVMEAYLGTEEDDT